MPVAKVPIHHVDRQGKPYRIDQGEDIPGWIEPELLDDWVASGAAGDPTDVIDDAAGAAGRAAQRGKRVAQVGDATAMSAELSVKHADGTET